MSDRVFLIASATFWNCSSVEQRKELTATVSTIVSVKNADLCATTLSIPGLRTGRHRSDVNHIYPSGESNGGSEINIGKGDEHLGSERTGHGLTALVNI